MAIKKFLCCLIVVCLPFFIWSCDRSPCLLYTSLHDHSLPFTFSTNRPKIVENRFLRPGQLQPLRHTLSLIHIWTCHTLIYDLTTFVRHQDAFQFGSSLGFCGNFDLLPCLCLGFIDGYAPTSRMIRMNGMKFGVLVRLKCIDQ